MVAADAHPKYLQTQMGHSSIRVTLDLYGHPYTRTQIGAFWTPSTRSRPIHTPLGNDVEERAE
jgi:integrase